METVTNIWAFVIKIYTITWNIGNWIGDNDSEVIILNKIFVKMVMLKHYKIKKKAVNVHTI